MDTIGINLSQVSSTDLVATATTQIMSDTPETLKRVVHAAVDEVCHRRHAASTRLWKARMEIQYAENEIRLLDGIPLKEVTGRDGDLDRSEYDGL